MPGWLNSAGSGPLTWMLSNATSTAWINRGSGQHQRKARQGEDDAAQTANVTVGVGIMIAHNPLHGSGRAAFPHPALALGNNAHAAQGIGITDDRYRQPAGDQAPHAVPKDATVLTAPRQRAMPEPPHLEPKDMQRSLVKGHTVIPDVYPLQRTGRIFPARCPGRVLLWQGSLWPNPFPLSPPPPVVRYCSKTSQVRSSSAYVLRLPDASRGYCSPGRTWDLPVPARGVCVRARGL
jgi:hypothetical protein